MVGTARHGITHHGFACLGKDAVVAMAAAWNKSFWGVFEFSLHVLVVVLFGESLSWNYCQIYRRFLVLGDGNLCF